MPDSSLPRVQFVISAKFLTLLIFAGCLLGVGYHWYQQQVQGQQRLAEIQSRFKEPPYFVNRGASVVRTCQQCLAIGKLKPQAEWKVGPPKEIPESDHRWFLAVEDPPSPVTVAGVLMLPVHPPFQDNPAFGFDQTRVMLVLFQNLERKPAIDQKLPPIPSQNNPATAATQQPPSLHVEAAGDMRWLVTVPSGGKWYNTGIPVVAAETLVIRPAVRKTYRDGEGHWSAALGEYQFDILEQEAPESREFEQNIDETQPFVTGPDWLDSLNLAVREHTESSFVLIVEIQLQTLTPYGHPFHDPWQQHVARHERSRQKALELMPK